MIRILVSACLMGERVRYDGRDNLLDHEILARWQREGRLVPVCPEVVSGLPTPRPPVEIKPMPDSDLVGGQAVLANQARLLTADQQDRTDVFLAGARQALNIAQQHNIQLAMLTEKSPSCGSQRIYDGTHQRQLISGEGVTTALLRQQGVEVYSQHQVLELADRLAALETSEEQVKS